MRSRGRREYARRRSAGYGGHAVSAPLGSWIVKSTRELGEDKAQTTEDVVKKKELTFAMA